MAGSHAPDEAPGAPAGRWQPPPPPGGPSWIPAHAPGPAPAVGQPVGLQFSWLLACLFPLFALIVLWMAFVALDQPDPATGVAGILLVLLVLLLAGAVALVVWTNPAGERGVLWAVFVPALVLAVPGAGIMVDVIESSYGVFGFFAFLVGAGMVLLIVVPLHGIFLAVAAVVRSKSVRAGDRVAQFAALATGGIFAGAAVVLLFTLPRQEQLARDAHDVPGLSVVLGLLVVVLCLVCVRRRR